MYVSVDQVKETSSLTKTVNQGSLKQQKLNVFFKRNDQKATEVVKNDQKTTEVKRKRQDSEEKEEEIEQPSCSSETAERAPTPEGDSVSETPDQKDIVSSDREDTESKTLSEPSEINKIKCNEIIEKLFLVNMPDDFYDFWEFCKSLSPKNPQGVITRYNARNVFFSPLLNLRNVCRCSRFD